MAYENRLIDCEQAKRATYEEIFWTESEQAVVRNFLAKLPRVDAVEVVHGRWKYYHKQNIAVCTNCSFERNLDADFGKAVSCPNCGAKMDGGDEGG